MNDVNFFSEDCEFLPNKAEQLKAWLLQIADQNGSSVSSLNYIFCSDGYLLQINSEHLRHDYYTDIITFDQSEEADTIEGDIFISIDRVGENAEMLGLPFYEELHRVMVHGLLHLLGYNDKSEAETQEMRAQEDRCLELRKL